MMAYFSTRVKASLVICNLGRAIRQSAGEIKKRRVLRKGHAVKYAWIDEQRNDYAMDDMCSVLEISVSGYQSWKRGGTPDRTRLTDAQMLALIRVIHEELKAHTAAREWSGNCGARVPSQQRTG